MVDGNRPAETVVRAHTLNVCALLLPVGPKLVHLDETQLRAATVGLWGSSNEGATIATDVKTVPELAEVSRARHITPNLSVGATGAVKHTDNTVVR